MSTMMKGIGTVVQEVCDSVRNLERAADLIRAFLYKHQPEGLSSSSSTANVENNGLKPSSSSVTKMRADENASHNMEVDSNKSASGGSAASQAISSTSDLCALLKAALSGDVTSLNELLSKTDHSDPVSCSDGFTALHYAVVSESVEAVQCVLQAGIHVDVTGGDALTPLHVASGLGHIEIAKILVEAGANMNALDANGSTPLMHACENENPALALWLLDNAARFIKKKGRGVSALTIACAKGSEEIVERILIERRRILLDCRDFRREKTVMHVAAGNGHLAVLRMLLDAGADANQFVRAGLVKELVKFPSKPSVKDTDLLTPLMVASIVGNANAAYILHVSGANVLKANRAGATALLLAAAFGHVQVVKFLLKLKVDIDARDKTYQTALHKAMMAGHTAVTELLLKKNALTEVKDFSGFTPFELAAKNGQTHIIWIMLDNDPEYIFGEQIKPLIDCAVKNGQAEFIKTLYKTGTASQSENAITLAVAFKHINCLQVLISAGYNINAKLCGLNKQPLLMAARKNELESLRILLAAGADVNMKAQRGKTCLHIAAKKGHAECIKALVEAGADVNSRTDTRKTPLHLAAARGHASCVEVLLAHGARVRAKNMFDRTPLHEAVSHEHFDVVRLLVGARARHLKKAECKSLYDMANTAMRGLLRELGVTFKGMNALE